MMEGFERGRSWRQTSRNMSRSISRNMSRTTNWGMEDVFAGSRQSTRTRRIDEDEEALKWAAIEKLPTYDRLRTSILQSFVTNEVEGGRVGDQKVVVDVTKMELSDRAAVHRQVVQGRRGRQ
ncbi:hypothetical protein MLD38_005643 [Melastoma candidum]|uniref:Uncharacterized protein n=1 Tax=Melastoma candidum TaxID=119954 RepID=A0ACB9RKE4_9MYRT|nr:hypothetical protein MLD38_005643 [Melastoma candidum]